MEGVADIATARRGLAWMAKLVLGAVMERC